MDISSISNASGNTEPPPSADEQTQNDESEMSDSDITESDLDNPLNVTPHQLDNDVNNSMETAEAIIIKNPDPDPDIESNNQKRKLSTKHENNKKIKTSDGSDGDNYEEEEEENGNNIFGPLARRDSFEQESRDPEMYVSGMESDTETLDEDEPKLDDKEETDEINLTDIIQQGISLDKPVELSDILEHTEDIEKVVAGDIDLNTGEDENEDNDDDEIMNEAEKETETKLLKDPEDEMDFDISEKLREMGEISVQPVSKSDAKKSSDIENKDEVSLEITKKGGSSSSNSNDDSEDKRKVTNLRKNIREVMDDNQLDASTLAAQREELERLARVQEQQKIIRAVQRQIELEKQNNKTQSRVISLLQGHTSLLKTSASNASSSKVTLPGSSGTVLVKIPASEAKNRGLKFGDAMKQNMANLTPSVSIAPVRAPIKKEKTDEEEREAKINAQIEAEEAAAEEEAAKAKKDIVTIVDSSSDDDCIVLSDDGEEDEPDDDPQNSGLHVNDAYNIPDDQGRVVINIGHPEGEPDIFVAPQIARIIKPHQIGGVRFLYDNIIESVDRFDTSTGFGCILAHSMGLGKTLQLVCFCDILLRHTSSKSVLCIMPINTLQNWLAEFNMWLPEDAEKTPMRAHGEVRTRNFKLHVLNDAHKSLSARSKVVLDWARDGGVLLIGYEMYRLLSLKKMTKKKKSKKAEMDPEIDREEIEGHMKLLEDMYEALVKPGPDLVVCDEGHRIKNSHASISLALKQIRSKRRIVLTGYPLQNNLLEYWCMVDFVRPNYLGTKTEFSNMFERPIQNGQCIDSTPQDIKLMRYRAHVLHSLLLGFVQRRSHVVLQTSLPQKEEYVMLVRMTEFQRKLYDIFMNDVVRTKAVPNPLKAFAVCCKIWNHPDVLYNFLRKREADLDLELEEAEAAANGTTVAAIQSKNSKKGATPRKSRSKKATNTTKTVDKDGKTKPAATISPTTGSSNSNSEATMSSSSTTSTQQSFATTNNQSESSSQSTTMGISQMNISQPTTMENTLNPQSGYNNSTFIKQESNSNNSNLMNQDVKPPQMASQATHNTNDGSSYTNYNQYSNTGYDSYNSYNSGNNYYGDYNSSYANQNSSQQNQQPATNNYYQNQYQTNYGYNQNQSGYPQNNMSNYWQNNPDYYQNNLGYNQNYPDYNTHHNQNLYGNNGNYPTDQQHQSQQQQQQQQQNYDNRYPSYDNRQNTQEWQSNSNIPTANTATSAPAATTMTTTSDIVGTPKSVTAEEDKSSAIVDMDTKEIKVESKPPITPPPEQNDASASASASAAASPSEVIKTEIKEEVKEEEIIKAKDDGIPYDWAIELMKGYVADLIQNSPKMEIFFCILEESLKLGDRMLVFSQSLLTLNLIEKFLQSSIVTGTEVKWAKNINYYRLDGSTSALDREKLINEFNSNPNIQLFLVSTRAGSLGINLVGANRVVVFDASWNPCHDTQAVCRVYRYGQKKPCFVYRLVMDNCLEKKIYDRQVNKQGMSDRVVDECNPDAHLSLREVTNLCWDDEKDSDIKDFSEIKDKFIDIVMQKVLESHSKSLSKEPFQHESLLIDRKEKKLSQAEKRLAQRGYELEKQAAARPSYVYNSVGTQYRTIRTPDGSIVHRPVASVRPMQAEMNDKMVGARPGGARPTRWIPAEVWQRQGMTAQEMTLPLDVVIPTSSAEKANIVLKAGQKVMVLKSPKGIYMQLESGKIIAIRTAFKMGQKQEVNKSTSNIITNTNANANSNSNTNINNRDLLKKVQTSIATSSNIPSGLKNNSSITVIPTKQQVGNKMITSVVKPGNNFGGASPSSQIRPMTIVNKTKIPMQSIIKNKNTGAINKNIQLATTKPYNLKQGAKFDVGMMKPTNFGPKKDAIESGNSSNSFDGKSAGSSEEINDLSKDDDTEIIEERSNKSFDVAMTNEPIVQDDENARDSDNMQLVSNNVKQEISTPIISNEATTEVPSESKKLDKEINNSNDSNQQPNKNEDVIMVSSEIKEPPKVLAPPQQQSDIYNVQPPYGMNYGTMPPYYYYPYQQQYPYYNQQQQQYYPGYPPPQHQQLHTQPSHLASYNPQTHSADLNYGGISAPISTPISTINQSTTVTAASQTMPNYPPSPIMSRSITQPKSSTAVSAPATTPTITIDDDIDPPLREKVVYKPNLVERKSRKNQQALPPPEPQHSMQYGSPGSQDTGMQSQSMARTSLKNYRHKAVTNKIQTAPTHNPMSHSHQIPPQYGIHQKEPERIYSPAQNQYPAPMMQNTQQNMSHDHYQFNQPKYENSSIRFLERTTSAIDDKQSGFNTSLTNITNSPSPSPIQQSSKEIMQPQFKPTKPVKTPKPRNRKKPEKNSPVIQPPPISQTQSQQSHGPLHQPQQQLQSHLQQQQQQQQQSQPQQQPQPQPQPQPQQQQLHSPLHQPVQPSTHMQQYPQSHIQQQSQSHMQQQPQSNLQHQPQSHLQQQTQSHLKHQQQSQSHQQQQSQMHPQHQLHSHQPISSNPPQPLKTPEPIMTNEKSTSKTSSKSKVPSIKNIPAPFSSSMAGLASSGGTASNSLLPTSTQNEIQSGGVSHKSLPGQYNPSHPPYYTTPPDPLSNYSQPTSAAVPISAAPPSQAQHHQASTVTATSQQQQQHQQSLYPPYSGSYGHLYTAPAAVVSHNSTTSMSSPAPTIASTTSSPTAIGLPTYTTPSYSLPPNPYETTTYTPPLSGSAFHRPDMSPPTIYSANPYSTIPASSTSQPSQDHTQTPTSSSSSLAPSIFTPSANIYQPPVIPPLPPPSIVTASYQSAYPSQFPQIPQIPPPSSVSQSTYPTPPPSGYGYHLPPSPYATAHYPGAPSVPYTLPPAGQYDPSRYPPPPPLPTTVDPQYPTYGAYGYSPYPPHSSAGQWQ